MRVLLVTIMFGLLSFAYRDNREHDNFLKNTKWRISNHAFADLEQESYTLSEIEDDDWIWGRFVSFNENSFSGDYSAPCGNDCFVTTNGTYQFIKEQTIFVNVEYISRSGFCEDYGVDTVGFKAYYSIESNGKGYELIKTKKP